MDCDWITQASPSALHRSWYLSLCHQWSHRSSASMHLSLRRPPAGLSRYVSTIYYLHSFAKLQTKSSFQKMWRSNQFNTSSPFIFVNIGLVFRTSFWLRETIVGKEKQDAKYKFLNVCVCLKFRGQNSLLLLHKMWLFCLKRFQCSACCRF